MKLGKGVNKYKDKPISPKNQIIIRFERFLHCNICFFVGTLSGLAVLWIRLRRTNHCKWKLDSFSYLNFSFIQDSSAPFTLFVSQYDLRCFQHNINGYRCRDCSAVALLILLYS